jgi:hypothetical protein
VVLDFSLFHPHRQYHSHSPIAQVVKRSEDFPMLLYHMDRCTLPRVAALDTGPGRTTNGNSGFVKQANTNCCLHASNMQVIIKRGQIGHHQAPGFLLPQEA